MGIVYQSLPTVTQNDAEDISGKHLSLRGTLLKTPPVLSYTSFQQTFLARNKIDQDKIVFRVNYTIEDLNGDGIDELFSYAISNGKCVHIDCYTIENTRLKQLSGEEAQLWLSSNQNYKNLILYSQIGMHENSK